MTHLLSGFAVLCMLTLTVPEATGQEWTLSPESKLWVDGTSNRSDFTVNATELEAQAAVEEQGILPGMLELTVAARGMKGDKSTIMDRLMHEALKVEAHPAITYRLVEAQLADDGRLIANGQLTLAGVTNDVEMTVTGERLDDGHVRYTGSMPITMSDYGMQPPTAMFGALRTADDVTVHFDVTFVPGS